MIASPIINKARSYERDQGNLATPAAMPRDCPIPEGKTCKRVRCGHGDVCKVHCGICTESTSTPGGTGRPSCKNRLSQRKKRKIIEVDYAEVDEHVGFVYSEEDDSESEASALTAAPASSKRKRKRNERSRFLERLGSTTKA